MTLKAARIRSLFIPPLILALGLAITLVVFQLMKRSHDAHEERRFHLASSKIVNSIREQVNLYQYGLRGARGLFVGSERVSRVEFMRYVASHNLKDEFPGAIAIGYVHRVKHDDLDAFTAKTRADGFAEFNVRTSNMDVDHYIIQFMEPMGDSLAVIGWDIGDDPVRRAAAERSMLSGQATITSPTPLVQDDAHRIGFIYMLPVYRHDMAIETAEQRRAALDGWVVMPLRMDLLMQHVSDVADEQIDFEVFDGADSNATTELFDADGHLGHVENPVTASDFSDRTFHDRVKIPIGGRTWTIWLSTLPEFDKASSENSAYIAAGALLLTTLLVTFIVALQGREELKAQQLAVEMTRSLYEEQAESRRLAAIASKMSDGVILMGADARIEWVNEAFTRHSGYTLDEVRGRVPAEIFAGPETDRAAEGKLTAALRGGYGVSGVEVVTYNKARQPMCGLIEIQPIFETDGSLSKFMAINRDITAQKLVARQVKESEARFRAAIEGGFDAFYLLRSVRDDGVNINDFEFIDLNERGGQVLGMRRGDLIGRRLSELLKVAGDQDALAKYVAVVQTGRTLDEERLVELPESKPAWVHHQAVRVGDGLAVTRRDITERKTLETQLRLAAETDRLTGLPNRGAFFTQVEASLEQFRNKADNRFAVMFLDFDRFKHVNDTLGHDAGDELLNAITGRLRATLRFNLREGLNESPTVIARLGGDEFVVLLRGIGSEADAARVATRLLESFNRPYSIMGSTVDSTASIGIVMSELRHRTAEEVIHDADAAMYAAKTGGKNRHVVFTPELGTKQSAA